MLRTVQARDVKAARMRYVMDRLRGHKKKEFDLSQSQSVGFRQLQGTHSDANFKGLAGAGEHNTCAVCTCTDAAITYGTTCLPGCQHSVSTKE
jgi:hypothetical protein